MPGIFAGPPYLHLWSETTLRISKMTHVPEDVFKRFDTALNQIVSKYPSVFVKAESPEAIPNTDAVYAPAFGHVTPEHVREVLRKDPELHRLLNASLASQFGFTTDHNGLPNMDDLCRVQTIINAPGDGGMLTGEEFQALLDQGYA